MWQKHKQLPVMGKLLSLVSLHPILKLPLIEELAIVDLEARGDVRVFAVMHVTVQLENAHIVSKLIHVRTCVLGHACVITDHRLPCWSESIGALTKI